jgi:hypothetical protein
MKTKPNISKDFTVDDIHKIREWHYELHILLFLLVPFVCSNAFAQTDEDRVIVEKFFSSTTVTTINNAMLEAAFFFLETPYIAGTLDSLKEESLVVNLRETDCMVLVENCLALSRTALLPSPDYEEFERELQQIRYRNGIINGYVSRLHYTTDWIFNNVEKGIFEDVTYALGGRKFKPNVHYMSENSQKYERLANDSNAVRQMAQIEKVINTRNIYYYIPKKEIAQRQSLIKDGDIICFTTSIPGLDVSHLGIAYWRKGQLTFIHASSVAKKVIINPNPLIEYCNAISTCTGIMVLRPIAPKDNIQTK